MVQVILFLYLRIMFLGVIFLLHLCLNYIQRFDMTDLNFKKMVSAYESEISSEIFSGDASYSLSLSVRP